MPSDTDPDDPDAPGGESAELSAAELGRRLQVVTRAAGIGWWSLEGDAQRARWSQELREMHGLKATDAVPLWGDWIREFAHPEEQAEIVSRWAAWMRGGGDEPLDYNFRIKRPEGGWRDILLHALIERGGATPMRFGVLIDISEQRSAERALRQANERAALAARGAGIGTWEHDLITQGVQWDEQMWALRGRPPRAQAPTSEELMSWVHPDDRETVRWAIADSTLTGRPLDQEFRIVLPDGRLRWIASRSTSIFDASGRPLRRIGVNWDITASREAEATRQARALAQSESEAKSRFLSRMSHELRTPLNAVIGFAELLLADETGGDEVSALRLQRVTHLLSAGRHLLTLVDDVLDLTALEGGELQISPEPVALAPLLADTAPLIEPALARHQVRLALGPLQQTVLADRTRLRQVLLNLLSNAVKFNRPGGWVEVGSEARGAQVVVRVSDSGRGMTQAQLAHLFEPFNRLGVDGEAIEGTGIGLTIVKSLVGRMGGSVEVHSRAGHGSVFELLLPGAPPAPRAPALAMPRAGNSGLPAAAGDGPPCILYIEDNNVNALIVTQLIARRPDLRLELAANGVDGLAMATRLRPALVLLDMQLPDIDGAEVFRRMRADPRTAQIPCIALSANALPDDIEQALHNGMADYWTKPLDFTAFMAGLDRWFGPAPRS